MKLNILVLAAGPVEYEAHDGGYPLCLAEVNGKPLLELIVQNTRSLKATDYAFAFLDSDIQRFHLNQVANLLCDSPKIVGIQGGAKGSACSALLGACGLDQESELLIISANELVELDLNNVLMQFRASKLDGGVITFNSVHPRYSYVRLNQLNLVVEAAQLNPISHSATTGIFWFLRTGDFVAAAKNLIRKNAVINKKFYVAPTYNELILLHKKIGVHIIDNSQYKPLKTERQMQAFERG